MDASRKQVPVSARERWSRYASGVLAESSFILLLALIGLLVAVFAMAAFR